MADVWGLDEVSRFELEIREPKSLVLTVTLHLIVRQI